MTVDGGIRFSFIKIGSQNCHRFSRRGSAQDLTIVIIIRRRTVRIRRAVIIIIVYDDDGGGG